MYDYNNKSGKKKSKQGLKLNISSMKESKLTLPCNITRMNPTLDVLWLYFI